MATEITNQFSGLDMSSLIGGPLQADCNAQLQLANATANFIQTVGMQEDNSAVRTVDFKYEQIKEDGATQKNEYPNSASCCGKDSKSSN